MAQGCPDDPAEMAEQYCLGTLTAEEEQAFEAHYIACPDCAARVEETQEFVNAMRDAARSMRAGDTRPKG